MVLRHFVKLASTVVSSTRGHKVELASLGSEAAVAEPVRQVTASVRTEVSTPSGCCWVLPGPSCLPHNPPCIPAGAFPSLPKAAVPAASTDARNADFPWHRLCANSTPGTLCCRVTSYLELTHCLPGRGASLFSFSTVDVILCGHTDIQVGVQHSDQVKGVFRSK